MVTNVYFQCHYFRFQKLCQLYWQLLNITSIRRVRYPQFFTIRISHTYLDLPCHYLSFLKLCQPYWQLLNITRQLDILKKLLSGYYLGYYQDIQVPYFREQFPRKLFFFEFNLMYCDLWLQYIQVRKLFKGGNYSRAETICGNTVFIY